MQAQVRRFSLSIQAKLLILLLGISFIPAALGIVTLYRGTTGAVRESLGLFFQERAEGTARGISDNLEEVILSVRAAAERLQQGVSLDEATEPQDRAIVAWAQINRMGEVVAARGSVPPQLTDLPLALHAEHPRSPIYLDEAGSGPHAPALRVFVSLEGRIPGFLVAYVPLQPFTDLYTRSSPGDQAQVCILTNRGTILGPPAPGNLFVKLRNLVHEQRLRLSGWQFISEENLPEYLVGYAAVRALRQQQNAGATTVDWAVVVVSDLQAIMPLFHALLWRNALFAVGLAAGIVAISFGVAKGFVRPLKSLHAQVERLAQGDFQARVTISTRDELEELAHAFNKMVAEIQRSRTELELQMRRAESRAQQVTLVNEVSRAILASFDWPRLVTTTHLSLRRLVEYDRYFLILALGEQRFRVWDESGSETAALGADLLQGLFQRVRSETVYLSSCETTLAPVLTNMGIATYCAIGLSTEQGVQGVLFLGRGQREVFTQSQRELLAQIGAFLTLAVQHIQLYEKLAEFAAGLEKKVEERAEQLRRVYEQLRQSERYAATGRLAAGVAHEINNPLGIIKNFVQLLRLNSNAPPDPVTLEAMDEELERIARIVRGLLDFARPTAGSKQPLDLNAEIRKLLPLLEIGFKKKAITLDVRLVEQLPQVLLDRDHARQILLNLIRNAEDAVGRGGRIVIRTYLDRTGNSPKVVLEVEDNGTGISPEHLSQIFDPFFTTRSAEGGLGLGLSIVYGLVSNAGGTIDVSSIPGVGTCFKVCLPPYEEFAEEVG